MMCNTIDERHDAVQQAVKMDEYQGWKNYETWVVALWMNNEEKYHEYTRELAQSITDDYEAAQALRDYVENYMIPDPVFTEPSVAGDLVNKALSRVDWSEIVQAQRED